MWHFDPLVYTLRHYADVDGHENWHDFDAVATLTLTGGGRAVISGLHGELTREMRDQLDRALREMGITELQAWRRRKLVTWR